MTCVLFSIHTFQPSYWCGTKPQPTLPKRKSRVSNEYAEIKKPGYFEDEPLNSVAGIQIQGLTKKFEAKGTEKVGGCGLWCADMWRW